MKKLLRAARVVSALVLVGVAAAIAVSNLRNAVQRANQKRTMGDLRSIGTAAEAYSIDFNVYPPSAANVIPVLYGSVAYPTRSVGVAAARFLTPTYIRVLPLTDGWGSFFFYSTNRLRQDYALVSPARDGKLEAPKASGPTTDFDTDIVFSDGQFTVYPEGTCQ